jgi:hypothetical protein
MYPDEFILDFAGFLVYLFQIPMAVCGIDIAKFHRFESFIFFSLDWTFFLACTGIALEANFSTAIKIPSLISGVTTGH